MSVPRVPSAGGSALHVLPAKSSSLARWHRLGWAGHSRAALSGAFGAAPASPQHPFFLEQAALLLVQTGARGRGRALHRCHPRL